MITIINIILLLLVIVLFFVDLIHAGVLQSHGVDHPRRAFRDPRRGIPEPGFLRRALEGEGAQPVDVVPLRELVPEPEGPAGGDYRVVQLNTAQADQ